MPRFPPPRLERFFDNRLIIVWPISQPKGPSPLENLVFRIHGNRSLEVLPNQEREVVIPILGDGNKFLITWVIRIPVVKSEITLTVDHDSFSEKEKHHLVLDPDRLPSK